MYASLLISLLAAFVAMLAKQWLNRYIRNAGRSMSERCGDRQRKLDGLEKWPFHLFVESLPVMLQLSLLLLACGLCRHMWSINTFVAYTLITFAAIGISFYLGVVVAGTSSYECPFQTPASAALRGLWKAASRQRLAITRSSISALSPMNWRILRRVPHLSLPIVLEAPVIPPRPPPWWGVDGDTFRTNADDIRCVSWILRNIADPEAIDTAIRFAGTIRWSEGGIDVLPLYHVILSTFRSCSYSSYWDYLGLTDRAYYSMRAILQIHVFTEWKPRGSTYGLMGSYLPYVDRDAGTPGGDVAAVLQLYWCLWGHDVQALYRHGLSPAGSPAHLQWASNLL